MNPVLFTTIVVGKDGKIHDLFAGQFLIAIIICVLMFLAMKLILKINP